MTKKTKKARSPVDEFLALSDAEKEAVVAEFDQEFIADKAKPLTPAMKRLWTRAKRKKPGRPRVGEGAERVLVTIERGLLKQADAAARKRGVSRSQAIGEGLKHWLKAG